MSFRDISCVSNLVVTRCMMKSKLWTSATNDAEADAGCGYSDCHVVRRTTPAGGSSSAPMTSSNTYKSSIWANDSAMQGTYSVFVNCSLKPAGCGVFVLVNRFFTYLLSYFLTDYNLMICL